MSGSQIAFIQADVPNALGDSFYTNVTTYDPSGGGTITQFGDTITLAPGGSTVNVAAMPTITTLVTNTTKLTYNGGLNITTIDGDLQVTNGNINVPAGNVTCNTLNYTTLNPPVGGVVANPAYVYYVATNGRLKSAGATGTINDPFSRIADALTMPSADPQGMTIYVATGNYNESFTVTISNTLRAVSIIGLSDDTRDSKRACINGTISIVGTVLGHTNTIDTVVLNNLRVSAPGPTTNAVYVTGVGIRVYLKNGLYSSGYDAPIFGFNAAVIQVYNTGTTKTNRVQLEVDNCSVTASGANVPLTYIWGNAQVSQITNSDFTNNGGSYALYTNLGNIVTVSLSGFTTTGKTAVFILPGLLAVENPATDATTNISNTFITSKADASNPIVALNNGYQGATVVVPITNISLCSVVNGGTETTGVASTTKYLDLNGPGIIVIQRSQIISTNRPSTITPYTTNYPNGSGLWYFSNTYLSALINVGLVLPPNLPTIGGWALKVQKLTTEP